MTTRRPRFLLTLVVVLGAVSAGYGQSAEVPVRFSSPCSAVLGSEFDVVVQALPGGRSLGAYLASIQFDPALLELLNVSNPTEGLFAPLPLERHDPSPGNVSLVGLNCETAEPGFGAVDLSVLRFRAIATSVTTAELGFETLEGKPQLLDFDVNDLTPSFSNQQIQLLVVPDGDCDAVPDDQDNCPQNANTNQIDSNNDGVGDVCQTLNVELIAFVAEVASDGSVFLVWETAAEQDSTGFFIARSETPSGPWRRLSKVPIAARGTELGGAIYQLQDRPTSRVRTVYYRLESVGSTGVVTRHPPIAVHFEANPPGRESPRGGDTR